MAKTLEDLKRDLEQNWSALTADGFQDHLPGSFEIEAYSDCRGGKLKLDVQSVPVLTIVKDEEFDRFEFSFAEHFESRAQKILTVLDRAAVAQIEAEAEARKLRETDALSPVFDEIDSAADMAP